MDFAHWGAATISLHIHFMFGKVITEIATGAIGHMPNPQEHSLPSEICLNSLLVVI